MSAATDEKVQLQRRASLHFSIERLLAEDDDDEDESDGRIDDHVCSSTTDDNTGTCG